MQEKKQTLKHPLPRRQEMTPSQFCAQTLRHALLKTHRDHPPHQNKKIRWANTSRQGSPCKRRQVQVELTGTNSECNERSASFRNPPHSNVPFWLWLLSWSQESCKGMVGQIGPSLQNLRKPWIECSIDRHISQNVVARPSRFLASCTTIDCHSRSWGCMHSSECQQVLANNLLGTPNPAETSVMTPVMTPVMPCLTEIAAMASLLNAAAPTGR